MLERGAKKTKEMQSKLNVAEKGDMLDFSFDDGTGVQVRCAACYRPSSGNPLSCCPPPRLAPVSSELRYRFVALEFCRGTRTIRVVVVHDIVFFRSRLYVSVVDF